MLIPKFWAKANYNDQIAWGWSNISEKDALDRAFKRAKEAASRFLSGESNRDKNEQYYFSAPFREEEITSSLIRDISESFKITRNRYGALVLNSTDLMILDIDVEQPLEKRPSIIELLTGSLRKKNKLQLDQNESATYNRIINWINNNSNYLTRVYKTAAGYRVIILNFEFKPESSESIKIMDELGVDPLYKKLCEKQRCFRARLTPKPWRCGLSTPIALWPFDSKDQEKHYARWLEEYNREIENFSTCKFLYSNQDTTNNQKNAEHDGADDGASKVPSEELQDAVKTQIELHDRLTRSSDDAVLA